MVMGMANIPTYSIVHSLFSESWSESVRLELYVLEILTHRTKCNLPGKHLTPSRKDSEDNSAERENFPPNWAKEDEAGVTHIMDFFRHISANPGRLSHQKSKSHTLWMSQLELNQDPSREKPKHAKKHNEDDAWHQTDNSQRRRQGEHPIAHDLGYHKGGNELP